MVHTLLNQQRRGYLLHRYPPRTHLSNRHESRLAYPPTRDPLLILFGWDRQVGSTVLPFMGTIASKRGIKSLQLLSVSVRFF